MKSLSRPLAALSAVALAATLTSCSSAGTSVSTSADPTSSAPASVAVQASASHSPVAKPVAKVKVTHAAPKPKPVAHVGSTITLKGDHGTVAVTLLRVTKTRATDDFSTPDAGNHYVAVQFRIKNSASSPKAYDDSPSNGAVLIDSKGQQFQSDMVMKIAAGPMLDSVKVVPGGVALGYIVFQVPNSSRVAHVQFALSSGFGATGQWTV